MTERGDKAPLFHAVLTARRSLGGRGLAWAAGALLGLAAVSMAVFLLVGAWPVAGFVGVEVAAAVVLLVLHHRAGRAREEITLDSVALRVARIDRAGRRAEETLPPGWLRVALKPADGARAAHVELTTHGRSLAVGAFLTGEEQAEFAAALEQALALWRSPALP